jgi:hypothetical protein
MKYADPRVLDQVLDADKTHEIDFTAFDLDTVIETVLIQTAIAAENQISSCRHCQNYTHEGRRGGSCKALDVVVQGSWQACHLAISTFQAIEPMEELVCWIPRDGSVPRDPSQLAPSHL